MFFILRGRDDVFLLSSVRSFCLSTVKIGCIYAIRVICYLTNQNDLCMCRFILLPFLVSIIRPQGRRMRHRP